MDVPQRTRTYRSHHLDSERWDRVALRPGDIVISTSMKAGTTWMQRIISLLVFGPGPLPASLGTLSPWIDSTFQGDLDEVVTTIEAQAHRRFLKSHLPFDALPYDPAVRYVYVGRDTRDVFMSAFNHYSGYTELTYSLLDAHGGSLGPMPRCPATERELWADWMTRSLFDWESDGWPFWSHHHHAASFWQFRHLPNLLMVHYADLLAGLEAEMRRIAAFVDIEVAEDAWPELVAAARFDAMKEAAIRHEGMLGLFFVGGADRFFHKGTNGRWRDVLTEDDLDLYQAAASQLDPALRAWLEAGAAPDRQWTSPG
jgi:aryl sulfotransferase